MTDVERALAELREDVEWPPTPRLAPRLAEDSAPAPVRRRRRALVLGIALALVALGVALAVPDARSAILRFFHLEGVTVERVETLPPAEERSLVADLGPAVSPSDAEAILGRPVVLPDVDRRSQFYARDGAVSVLLATSEPVLLTEFAAGNGEMMLKKVSGGATGVEWVEVSPGNFGIWISGQRHVVYFLPRAPARFAGNVLLFERDDLTFRLEGPNLTRERALELAREILE